MATRDHGEDQGSDISRPLLLASSVTVSRGPIEAGFGLTTPGSLPPRHANRQSSQERRPDDESTDMSRNGPNLDRQLETIEVELASYSPVMNEMTPLRSVKVPFSLNTGLWQISESGRRQIYLYIFPKTYVLHISSGPSKRPRLESGETAPYPRKKVHLMQPRHKKPVIQMPNLTKEATKTNVKTGTSNLELLRPSSSVRWCGLNTAFRIDTISTSQRGRRQKTRDCFKLSALELDSMLNMGWYRSKQPLQQLVAVECEDVCHHAPARVYRRMKSTGTARRSVGLTRIWLVGRLQRSSVLGTFVYQPWGLVRHPTSTRASVKHCVLLSAALTSVAGYRAFQIDEVTVDDEAH
ncbi:hypothetical protein NOF04DRAFT_1282961 [Fusarium oxysporum II5]|nr:hypothetical protein NOF04DRAFT_1282961 [Fusarium oxysporum II5]